MDEKYFDELADELADQLGEDIRSGVSFSTWAAVPNPALTEEDIEKIKRSLERQPFTLSWRLYCGIDWGKDRDRTGHYFPSA